MADGGKVFVEQQQVVAEVEVGLAGIGRRQGAAAEMVDVAGRHTPEGVAHEPEPPAQVYLLHMGEEPFVKPSGQGVEVGPDHEGCPGGPEDLGWGVILPLVLLDGVEDASAAVGVAVAVDEAAGCPGVFKPVSLFV